MTESWLIFFAAVAVLLIVLGVIISMQLLAIMSRLAERDPPLPAPGRHRHGGHSGEREGPPVDLGSRKQDAKDQKKLFQEFINERPEILDEPKKTQFNEFRQWREDRGM